MSRYSYDDMPPEGYREKGGMRRSSSLIIAFIGVLITLIAILLYLMFSPQEEASQEETDALTLRVQEAAEQLRLAVTYNGLKESLAEAEKLASGA